MQVLPSVDESAPEYFNKSEMKGPTPQEISQLYGGPETTAQTSYIDSKMGGRRNLD